MPSDAEAGEVGHSPQGFDIINTLVRFVLGLRAIWWICPPPHKSHSDGYTKMGNLGRDQSETNTFVDVI